MRFACRNGGWCLGGRCSCAPRSRQRSCECRGFGCRRAPLEGKSLVRGRTTRTAPCGRVSKGDSRLYGSWPNARACPRDGLWHSKRGMSASARSWSNHRREISAHVGFFRQRDIGTIVAARRPRANGQELGAVLPPRFVYTPGWRCACEIPSGIDRAKKLRPMLAGKLCNRQASSGGSR